MAGGGAGDNEVGAGRGLTEVGRIVEFPQSGERSGLGWEGHGDGAEQCDECLFHGMWLGEDDLWG